MSQVSGDHLYVHANAWDPAGWDYIQGRLVVPGSAGQPRDGNPAACYAMFDDADASITYHRVPYDHDTARDKMLAAALPQRLAHRLEDGQ
jgi:diadenosine tetraphosphatase ApaH/serine/threonine PP2A family protein phosphatase